MAELEQDCKTHEVKIEKAREGLNNRKPLEALKHIPDGMETMEWLSLAKSCNEEKIKNTTLSSDDAKLVYDALTSNSSQKNVAKTLLDHNLASLSEVSKMTITSTTLSLKVNDKLIEHSAIKIVTGEGGEILIGRPKNNDGTYFARRTK